MPTDWARLVEKQRNQPDAVLGSGMEGIVLAIGDGLVAKVWHEKTSEDLGRLQSFYTALVEADRPFRTPRIRHIVAVDGRWATIEDRLSGSPVTRHEIGALAAVLGAFAHVDPVPAMSTLPVLADEPPFSRMIRFEQSLADLVERRAERFDSVLGKRLPDLAGLVGDVTDRLRSFEPVQPRLLHGDLIPANVLVDPRGKVSGVLDFGFMTTVGDPAFDAAVTASIFDMYGPEARIREAELDAAFARGFGYDEERLTVYRAAYALVTANCFSHSGSDGHFDWCMHMLERNDIRDVLAL